MEQNTIAANGTRRYSIDEYLEFERCSIEKHEYYNGDIFDMDHKPVPDEVIEHTIKHLLESNEKHQDISMVVKEAAPDHSKRKYTFEEYLEIENASVEKHEYYKGEIFAMSGAKLQHNIVSKNILTALDRKLNKSPCQPFNSETRVYIEKSDLATYPDISVICGEPQTLNNDDYNVLNPSVIFEVLSPSTKDHDRDNKFKLFRSIQTFNGYILVDPENIHIEAYHKNKSGFWELREYNNIEDTLKLPTLKISIPLNVIYKKTKVGGQ